MLEIISKPWPWFIAGPLIALLMFLLLWFGKSFGVSSNLRTLCAIAGAGKRVKFFDFNWKDQVWNLLFVVGAGIGGWIAVTFLGGGQNLDLSQNTVKDLSELGIAFNGSLMPTEIFSWDMLLSPIGLVFIVLGGFFVGFGTRYAGGCTSGHAISGLSNLQLPSLIAVIGFFIGGLIITHLIFPLIL